MPAKESRVPGEHKEETYQTTSGSLRVLYDWNTIKLFYELAFHALAVILVDLARRIFLFWLLLFDRMSLRAKEEPQLAHYRLMTGGYMEHLRRTNRCLVVGYL
jgi:hypothetical protein